MPPIFISYSRKDGEYTLRLVEELERRGFAVWIDQRIEGGSKWWREITERIRECCAMIVVMTPNSEQSDMVEKEILLAQEEKKKVVPLLLRGKRFDFFVNVQCTDVTSGELPPEDFYKQLPEEAKNNEGLSKAVLGSTQLQQVSVGDNSYPRVIQQWRATKSLDNEARVRILLGDAGQPDNAGAWEIQLPEPLGRGTFGPYIRLQPNKYRVTFRLKIDANTGEDELLADIDATSRMAHKKFALQTITVQDFYSRDTYQDFHLVFELFKPEENFEFRIRTNSGVRSKRRLTLDYVELRTQ